MSDHREYPIPDAAIEAATAAYKATEVAAMGCTFLAAMSPEDRAAFARWLTDDAVPLETDEAFEARIEAATVKRIVNRIRGTGFDGATRVADLIYREFRGDGDAT